MSYAFLRFAPQPHMHRRRANRIHGFSLVEVMVSLAIGLVVIGTVFANYLNNSSGARQAAALTQVTQDASLAMGILRNHIAMAGYSRPIGVSGTGDNAKITKVYAGDFIYGCTEGFADGTKNKADYSNVACNATSAAGVTPQPDSLAVRYEADTESTPTVNATPVPVDCTGSGLSPLTAGAGTGALTYYLADSRFTILPAQTATATQPAMPPSLGCLGNGNTGPNADLTGNSQPLVENIVGMKIWYGVGQTASDTNVAQYLTADQVPAGDWSRVISVRICLLVRSNDEVMSQASTPFYDCLGNVQYINDRRIYRAFKTTVVLNNRAGSNQLAP
ncbi:MAG: PilW family protein [Aquabacterium sp.]